MKKPYKFSSYKGLLVPFEVTKSMKWMLTDSLCQCEGCSLNSSVCPNCLFGMENIEVRKQYYKEAFPSKKSKKVSVKKETKKEETKVSDIKETMEDHRKLKDIDSILGDIEQVVKELQDKYKVTDNSSKWQTKIPAHLSELISKHTSTLPEVPYGLGGRVASPFEGLLNSNMCYPPKDKYNTEQPEHKDTDSNTVTSNISDMIQEAITASLEYGEICHKHRIADIDKCAKKTQDLYREIQSGMTKICSAFYTLTKEDKELGTRVRKYIMDVLYDYTHKYIRNK